MTGRESPGVGLSQAPERRIADPYFMTNDQGALQIGGFGARHVTERRFASSLIVALVVINQLQVAINIRLSFFNRG